MKATLAVIFAVAGVTAFADFSAAASKGTYQIICNSSLLTNTDRLECRKQMKAAKTDAERASIFRTYDLKIAGIGPDGKRPEKK